MPKTPQPSTQSLIDSHKRDQRANIGRAAGVGAAAVAGAKLLRGSKKHLTGRETLFHGTTVEGLKAIKEHGLSAAMTGKGVNTSVLEHSAPDIYKASLGKSYTTPSKRMARLYHIQSAHGGPQHVLDHPGLQRGAWNPFGNKGIAKMDVPTWKHQAHANPEISGISRLDFVRKKSGRTSALDRRSLLQRAADSNSIYSTMKTDRVFHGDVPTEYIRGSHNFKGLSRGEWAEYASKHKGRVAKGALMAAGGVAAIGAAAYGTHKYLQHRKGLKQRADQIAERRQKNLTNMKKTARFRDHLVSTGEAMRVVGVPLAAVAAGGFVARHHLNKYHAAEETYFEKQQGKKLTVAEKRLVREHKTRGTMSGMSLGTSAAALATLTASRGNMTSRHYPLHFTGMGVGGYLGGKKGVDSGLNEVETNRKRKAKAALKMNMNKTAASAHYDDDHKGLKQNFGAAMLGMGLAERFGYATLRSDFMHNPITPGLVNKGEKGLKMLKGKRWPWLVGGAAAGLAGMHGARLYGARQQARDHGKFAKQASGNRLVISALRAADTKYISDPSFKAHMAPHIEGPAPDLRSYPWDSKPLVHRIRRAVYGAHHDGTIDRATADRLVNATHKANHGRSRSYDALRQQFVSTLGEKTASFSAIDSDHLKQIVGKHALEINKRLNQIHAERLWGVRKGGGQHIFAAAAKQGKDMIRLASVEPMDKEAWAAIAARGASMLAKARPMLSKVRPTMAGARALATKGIPALSGGATPGKFLAGEIGGKSMGRQVGSMAWKGVKKVMGNEIASSSIQGGAMGAMQAEKGQRMKGFTRGAAVGAASGAIGQQVQKKVDTTFARSASDGRIKSFGKAVARNPFVGVGAFANRKIENGIDAGVSAAGWKKPEAPKPPDADGTLPGVPAAGAALPKARPRVGRNVYR